MKKNDDFNLEGVQILSKEAMKAINGGRITGTRCYEHSLYVDVEYSDGSYECDIYGGIC